MIYDLGECGETFDGCNQAVGHLSVEQKLLLKRICQEMGVREMYISARKMVRAQLRAAFSNSGDPVLGRRCIYENRKRPHRG